MKNKMATETTESLGFSVVDYIIFAITVVISLAIGCFHALSGGKQKTTSEYLMGDRKMSIFPVTLSLIVSFESSIMMLAYPAEVYSYGAMFLLSSLGFLFATLLGTRIVVPLIHPLKITSVYEYLELRYHSKVVRLIGSVLGMLSNLVYMAFVLYGPGLAIEAVTDFPLWASVVCISSASVVYTAIGGIKAVIWTDVFQCMIMFTGVAAILIKGTIDAGGSSEVIKIVSDTGRLNFINFDPDPRVRHTFWGLVIGSTIRLLNMTFSQATVQRICAVPRAKDANKMLCIAGPAFLLTLSLACSEGLVAYAYFASKGCDPLAAKHIKKADQILPYMVFNIFRNTPGMAGLFMAAVFSASLSTLSSLLNSMAAMTEEDFLRPMFKNWTDAKATFAAKVSVLVFGIIAVGFTYFFATVKGIISQISTSFTSALTGPMTGLFLFSVFYPWATKRSAIIGTLLSVIFSFWLTLGQALSPSLQTVQPLPLGPTDQCPSDNISIYLNNSISSIHSDITYNITQQPFPFEDSIKARTVLDNYYSLSYLWVSVLGQALAVGFGIIVSLIEGCIVGFPDSKSIDVRYVLPFFDQLFPCLPVGLLKRLHRGVPFEKRNIMLEKYGNEPISEDTPVVSKSANGDLRVDKPNIKLLSVQGIHQKDHEHNEANF